MTTVGEGDIDPGILVFSSASTSSTRIASQSSHPLRGDTTSEEMQIEEQGRLLQEGESSTRPSYASRAQTFGGTGKKASTEHVSLGLGRPENGREPATASGSLGRLETRNRSSGDDARTARAGSIPPRLSTIARSLSQYGPPSIGTGWEGHPASRHRVDDEAGVQAWRSGAVGDTPLERTIDAIGMGRYQYAVLVLSGLGWAADNMWLQGVAIILPRVQDEWQIGDQWIGLVSSCTFAGMMVGALTWGSYSDTFGRKNAFNATLLITSIFGLLSSLSPSFPLLCLCLFLLGTGVGGSMPTDGTIFLEAVPKRNHYLLTALSVFFAAGSVVTSSLGLIIIPKNSCGGVADCDVANNKGWRWLLASLGALTMLFVIARLVFFSLYESPKFLVSAGRHEEARSVLQRIAAFNGEPKKVRLSDVHDQEEVEEAVREASEGPGGLRGSLSRWKPKSWIGRQSTSSMDWQEEVQERQRLIVEEQNQDDDGVMPARDERPIDTNPPKTQKGRTWIPRSWAPSIQEAKGRYKELFSPHWAKTTTLVWSIWTVFTLAYTMVNIFLPKYLENRSPEQSQIIDNADARQHKMESVMQEFLFYSMASLPGSLLGAYLIETSLGRIKSMAISTALLSLSLLSFALAHSHMAVIATSCSISLFASVSYAVIYSYSPEVFETKLRGTASGTASALSRFAGMLAPVLAGILMNVDANLPLYLGFALFALTVWLELSLPYETRTERSESNDTIP
ncbi:hypothetical protein CBS101457_000783 [Exobasidium rhododendri]|nr:hypothetical protein CBS101457_000783 [Exobasidium rhododendri]